MWSHIVRYIGIDCLTYFGATWRKTTFDWMMCITLIHPDGGADAYSLHISVNIGYWFIWAWNTRMFVNCISTNDLWYSVWQCHLQMSLLFWVYFISGFRFWFTLSDSEMLIVSYNIMQKVSLYQRVLLTWQVMCFFIIKGEFLVTYIF